MVHQVSVCQHVISFCFNTNNVNDQLTMVVLQWPEAWAFGGVVVVCEFFVVMHFLTRFGL